MPYLHPRQRLARLRSYGWRAAEPYPGHRAPWKVTCTRCGAGHAVVMEKLTRTPRAHTCPACNPPPPRALPESEALLTLAAFGFTPAAPYPGGASKLWRVRCLTCGNLRTVRISALLGQPAARTCHHTATRATTRPTAGAQAIGDTRPC